MFLFSFSYLNVYIFNRQPVIEELEKVLAFNNKLVSLKSHPDASRFARGVGPVSLIGLFLSKFSFLIHQGLCFHFHPTLFYFQQPLYSFWEFLVDLCNFCCMVLSLSTYISLSLCVFGLDQMESMMVIERGMT